MAKPIPQRQERAAVDVDNRERDLNLETRPESLLPPLAPAAPANPHPAGVWKERIEAARKVKPGAGPHWLQAWQAGRDSAVAAAKTGSVATAKALSPPDVVGCRDCWTKGRDAAVRVLEGA